MYNNEVTQKIRWFKKKDFGMDEKRYGVVISRNLAYVYNMRERRLGDIQRTVSDKETLKQLLDILEGRKK